MCAAIDMIASDHSYYGISPPAGFLTDYLPPKRLTNRGFSAPCLTVLKPLHLTLKPAPRSCLRVQPDKCKKKVVFADTKGLALEQVKFMTEPSHVPPYWALKLVQSPPVERKVIARSVVDVWEARFAQPASDYLEFRRRITDECVALENVIVKQSDSAIDGTVKVKNIDFTKEVFVRSSSDGWRTHEDSYCAFIESGPVAVNNLSLYDTFGFRVQLPVNSRRLDFCVCFKCNGCEYWDSNNGNNYTIEKSSARASNSQSCARIKYGNSWRSRTECIDGNTPYW